MSAMLSAELKASSYDRSACEIGIVHLGPGAFHRAHQAYYVDAMMEKTGDLSWGIAGVNLRAADRDYLNHLSSSKDGYVLKSVDAVGGCEFRLVRSIVSYADWSQDAALAEQLLALASVKLVTITVTESGYYVDENKSLNLSSPVIASEISGGKGTSVYAYLRAGLNARRASDSGPISILCCDNIRDNGHLLQRNFEVYLECCNDLELLSWLQMNASFPSSMVDRITPKPDNRTFDEVARLLGRDNDPSVLAEDFVQWVLEDKFAGTRPPLDEVGVQIVRSVTPFEETKIRVLNGGHTCLAYLGVLRGHETYDQAINDPVLAEHFNAYENDEVLAALPDDLPFDINEYLAVVSSRFHNPYVSDALKRICMDGVGKFPIYILPTVSDCLEQGKLPGRAIVTIASWYIFAKRIHDGDLDFDYIEPNMSLLEPYLHDGRVEDFSTAKALWGDLAQKFPEFSVTLCREIENLDKLYPAGIQRNTSVIT